MVRWPHSDLNQGPPADLEPLAFKICQNVPYKTGALNQTELWGQLIAGYNFFNYSNLNLFIPKQPLKKCKKRSEIMKKELQRNIVHLLLGVMLAVVILNIQHETALVLFGILLIIGTLLSELRIRGKKLPLINWFLKKFERNKVRPGLGAINFLIGVFISLVFFDSYTVFLSVLVLAFNDSFSTVTGIAFGKHKIRGKKTLEGSIGGFIGTVFIMSFFINSLASVLIISLAATIIEAITTLDDNLIIPPSISLLIKIIK